MELGRDARDMVADPSRHPFLVQMLKQQLGAGAADAYEVGGCVTGRDWPDAVTVSHVVCMHAGGGWSRPQQKRRRFTVDV